MRLPMDLRVPDPLYKLRTTAALPSLTEAEEREFLDQGFLCRVTVHVPGRSKKQRMIVEVDGQEVELTLRPFQLFLRLVLALYTEPSGWVNRGTMKYAGGLTSEGYYRPEGAEQALNRLRTPFSTALGPALDANDFLEVGHVTWDRRQLLIHPHERVLEVARALSASGYAS